MFKEVFIEKATEMCLAHHHPSSEADTLAALLMCVTYIKLRLFATPKANHTSVTMPPAAMTGTTPPMIIKKPEAWRYMQDAYWDWRTQVPHGQQSPKMVGLAYCAVFKTTEASSLRSVKRIRFYHQLCRIKVPTGMRFPFGREIFECITRLGFNETQLLFTLAYAPKRGCTKTLPFPLNSSYCCHPHQLLTQDDPVNDTDVATPVPGYLCAVMVNYNATLNSTTCTAAVPCYAADVKVLDNEASQMLHIMETCTAFLELWNQQSSIPVPERTPPVIFVVQTADECMLLDGAASTGVNIVPGIRSPAVHRVLYSFVSVVIGANAFTIIVMQTIPKTSRQLQFYLNTMAPCNILRVALIVLGVMFEQEPLLERTPYLCHVLGPADHFSEFLICYGLLSLTIERILAILVPMKWYKYDNKMVVVYCTFTLGFVMFLQYMLTVSVYIYINSVDGILNCYLSPTTELFPILISYAIFRLLPIFALLLSNIILVVSLKFKPDVNIRKSQQSTSNGHTWVVAASVSMYLISALVTLPFTSIDLTNTPSQVYETLELLKDLRFQDAYISRYFAYYAQSAYCLFSCCFVYFTYPPFRSKLQKMCC